MAVTVVKCPHIDVYIPMEAMYQKLHFLSYNTYFNLSTSYIQTFDKVVFIGFLPS